MPKEIIHFAHANGFPALTYSKLFSLLKDDFEIGYIERQGHDPEFPVNDGWSNLRDELGKEIEGRYDSPIIGMGHSLGGILHFLLACKKPQLYSRIILLDSPIIGPLSSFAIRLGKKLNLIDRFSPSRVARLRRNNWQSKEEAFQHYKQKEKFAAFDEDMLRDYIEHGCIESENGIELYFKPEIEAAIYRGVPHNLPSYRGKSRVPISYISGGNSEEGKLAGLGFMKKHIVDDFHTIEGTHLFPMEKPLETAKLIKRILN
jgi:pimeloyl-ACP methyl ester carboxylesterase